jgi:hypothetical protein
LIYRRGLIESDYSNKIITTLDCRAIFMSKAIIS